MTNIDSSVEIVMVIAPGIIAGAEKVVLTGADALLRAGQSVSLICIEESRNPQLAHNFIELLNKDVKVYKVTSQGAIDVSIPSQIKAIFKQINKSKIVIHTHGFKALVTTFFAKENYPIIHTHHGNTGHTLKVKIYEYIAFQVMKKCNLVVAVSEQMREMLISTLRPFEKIVTVDNMLSLSNSKEIVESRLSFQKSNPEMDLINLVYVGRLGHEKGILRFCEYFAKTKLNSKFYLTIVGDGADRLAIEQLVKDNDLSSRVMLVGFSKNPSQYFSNAHVLVMPSFTEGLPLTLIESLSCGLPVLGSSVGALPLFVQNNLNGLLIENHTFEDWEQGLQRCIDQYKKWNEYAINHSGEIANRFDSKTWAQNMIKNYSSVL